MVELTPIVYYLEYYECRSRCKNHDKEKIKAYLRNKIEDLSDNLNQNVFVVKDVAEVLDQSRFELLCKHFNLDFTLDSFSAVKNVIN